jgi:hypothetical protein
MGSSPDEVVIDGDGQRAVGINVRGDGVRIENLTVRDHGTTGIAFDAVEGFAAERVSALANGSHGIRALGSRRGSIRDSSASDSARAGISIEGCEACDVVVDGASVEGNAVGVLVENGGSITVLRSEIRRNGAGVVMRAIVSREPRIPSGAHLWRNTIVDNADPDAPRSEHSLGAGVWIASGRHSRIEDNVITGHRYGVVVTGAGPPSLADRIERNTVDDSSLADLAWDGLGADVCFRGNVRPDGLAPSSEPPEAQTLYPCDMPHTVGIPWPAVTARMLAPGP